MEILPVLSIVVEASPTHAKERTDERDRQVYRRRFSAILRAVQDHPKEDGPDQEKQKADHQCSEHSSKSY